MFIFLPFQPFSFIFVVSSAHCFPSLCCLSKASLSVTKELCYIQPPSFSHLQKFFSLLPTFVLFHDENCILFPATTFRTASLPSIFLILLLLLFSTSTHPPETYCFSQSPFLTWKFNHLPCLMDSAAHRSALTPLMSLGIQRIGQYKMGGNPAKSSKCYG